MKPTVRIAAIVAALFILGLGSTAGAQTPTDLPAKHWAREAALAVTSRGVMAVSGGKFDGARKVTRTELVNTLAAFARALEKGAWKSANAPSRAGDPEAARLKSVGVTRYELAFVLDKVAQNVMLGLPKPKGKIFGTSEAIGPVAVTGVPASHPAYASLTYLAKNRMIVPESVLLKPSSTPVTGAEVADSITRVVIGVTDRLTDEPQNRLELGEPPHSHGKEKP